MRKEKLEELKNYINELKTIEMQKIDKDAGFLKSEVYECHINNGEVINREKIIKGNKDGSAAIILPLTMDNNVILTVEPRVFSERTVGIGIPAGYIEEGEQPKEAALRELREEIGYVPRAMIDLGGFYQDMGCSGAFNHVFMALDCEKKFDQQPDPGEFIKYFECTFEEALELMKNNYIQGCNAIITLERAKQFVKRR